MLVLERHEQEQAHFMLSARSVKINSFILIACLWWLLSFSFSLGIETKWGRRGLAWGYAAGRGRNRGYDDQLKGRLPLSGKEMPWATVKIAGTD